MLQFVGNCSKYCLLTFHGLVEAAPSDFLKLGADVGDTTWITVDAEVRRAVTTTRVGTPLTVFASVVDSIAVANVRHRGLSSSRRTLISAGSSGVPGEISWAIARRWSRTAYARTSPERR